MLTRLTTGSNLGSQCEREPNIEVDTCRDSVRLVELLLQCSPRKALLEGIYGRQLAPVYIPDYYNLSW